jgi:Protein of unknown function (DUF1573)
MTTGIRGLVLHALLAWAPVGFAAQGLVWDAATKEAKLPPLATHFGVQFSYKNTAMHEVKILHVDTNCDCLSATPDPKVLAPGATGTLNARFTVGDRLGVYERTITVLTTESATPTRLTVRIEVPEAAALTPRAVEWALNSAPAERAVEIAIADGLAIELGEIGYSSTGFRARLETLQAGRAYRLWMKPESTAAATSAAVRVFGREKSGRNLVLSAYASVR